MIPKEPHKTHSVISNVRTRTKSPSNANANFESTRFFFSKKDLIRLSDDLRHLSNRFRLLLQTRLFSNTVSSNNGVFKGKVFKQKRDNTTNWKSHQENFDSQTKLRLTKPNNNVQSLDYITRYCVYFVLLEVT